MFSILLFKQSVYAENKAKAVPENRGAGLEGRQLFCPGYETGGALIVQRWDKNKPWPWEVHALQPYKVTGGNPNSPDASTALKLFRHAKCVDRFQFGDSHEHEQKTRVAPCPLNKQLRWIGRSSYGQ